MTLRYLPNVLSLARVAFIVPFLIFIAQHNYVYAFYIFLLSGFTDGLDGWLARYFHWNSAFGSLIDPVADKLLIVSSFIALACIGVLPWWLVVLVFLRDITISVGVVVWYYLLQSIIDFKPTYLSKFNTVLQLALVTLCLFKLAFMSVPTYLLDLLIIITTVTTATSYLDYVWTWSYKAYTFRAHIK